MRWPSSYPGLFLAWSGKSYVGSQEANRCPFAGVSGMVRGRIGGGDAWDVGRGAGGRGGAPRLVDGGAGEGLFVSSTDIGPLICRRAYGYMQMVLACPRIFRHVFLAYMFSPMLHCGVWASSRSHPASTQWERPAVFPDGG